MRVAISLQGTITNIVEAADVGSAQALFPDAIVFEAGSAHKIGYIDDGEGGWIAPPLAPDTVPATITTRRQIMTGLALEGWITEQEALDAIATGARPAAVEAVINTLPEGERFHARMKWAGFLEAHRDDPLVLALAAAEGKTPQEVDDFFVMCAGID